MFEFTCEYCGKVVQVEKEWQVQRFCNKSCAASYRNEKQTGWTKFEDAGECVFQPESVICGKRICNNCGWNPEVAQARLERIME